MIAGMTVNALESGFAPIHGALIHYEVAGEGTPFVMLHAGVADSRQWNGEFDHFQQHYRVLRYDLRGYGKSEPVEGEFSHLQDLHALLNHLHIHEPLVLMGCSMGGGLAMDFALADPARVRALILVGAGPSGLKLDVPGHPKFADAERAYTEGNLDLVAELETQIWFDGMGRTSAQVNPTMRSLVYQMNRRALELEARHLGKRLPDAAAAAAGRLGDLTVPVLILTGEHDVPFILAAAEYMSSKLPTSRKVMLEDAAHLPNLDRPDEFRRRVSEFLAELPSK
jgi:pimeloyl-ACP methyl ester carboxylesterase